MFNLNKGIEFRYFYLIKAAKKSAVVKNIMTANNN
jgi:hypothetical protein